MADALGIIGVIGVAGQILQLTVKFGHDWKDAPEDAKSFLKEIQALKTVLSETHSNILVDEDFKAAFEGRRSALLAEFGDPTQSTSTSSLINACKMQLENVLFDLKRRKDGHRLGWERLKGAFTAKKTREAVEDLQRRCLSLNSLISLDTLSLGVQTYKEAKQTRQEQTDWKSEQRAREILNWLSKDDYGAQQSDILRRRQAGTGQWLLDSPEYKTWVTTIQTTLFCPGIPGAGKTTLTSIVVDDLQNRFGEDENASIAYLYCNFRRQQEQTVENLLSSILRQLAQDQTSIPDCVKSLHKRHNNKTRPSLEQLSNTLRALIGSLPKVYIIVDALDECQLSDGTRAQFLNTIFDLQSSSKVNIFATSRFITDITDMFTDATSFEIRAHEEDVRRFLEGSISHLPACVGKSLELQEEIMRKIIEAVDGMFLLAQLHFDSLKGKRSVKAIRKALGVLHTGSGAYDEAYDDAMERIASQLNDQNELARQALMWIACAMRPLTTFEIREALAIELGEPNVDPDNVPEIEDIISVCAGLVTVDEESNIIRLVHYTTQEYFSRTSHRWFPDAHCHIAEICVTYLSFEMFSDHPYSTDYTWHDRLESCLILYYAVEFWSHHASMPESEPCNPLVSSFFLLRFSDTYLGPNVSNLMLEELGPEFFMTFLFMGKNELVVASSEADVQRVRYLLQRGARPNVHGRGGRTPLSSALSRGDMDVVKILLEWDGIDVNAKDLNGDTPLHAAFRSCSNSIINMLLAVKDIDLDVENEGGETLLHTASQNGLEDMVRMLLRCEGRQINARNKTARETPLHLATSQGHEAVVRMLLDSDGIEVNARKRSQETPLHLAAASGHETIARMLLDAHGIEVNAKDFREQTPLHVAASRNPQSVALMLLNTMGIEVNGVDCYGATPFSHAARVGHLELLQLLHGTGKINVNDTNRVGMTPFAYGVRCGLEEVVRFFLGVEEIDCNQTFKGGVTLLHLAAMLDSAAIVKALVLSGKFDVNQTNETGRTPLWVAADHGKEGTVEFLVGVKAVVLGLDIEDSEGRTAQCVAVLRGHSKVARLIQEASDKHISSQGEATRLA